MPLITINGIEVDFPYPPYPPQIRYMSHVIDSLRTGRNALLESPTGTGKTLCLLCATLAWRATYIAALQAHANARPGDSAQGSLFSNAGLQPPTGAASALAALVRPEVAPHLSAPRIVFSSRTHSQLAQAVSELKKTVYKPVMVQLASRDQLCINDTINKSGSRLNTHCRRITAPTRRGCSFYLPVMSNREGENRSQELVQKLSSSEPMDIEDLKIFGTSHGACPYFLSREAAKDDSCEILFIPYNYLLDKSVRGSLGIDWANDVIIIDEAHNLESICSESMGFDLSESMRKTCDSELSALLENAIRPGGLTIPALEGLEKTDHGLDKLIGSENCDIREIRHMRTIMVSVENFVTNVKLDRGENSDISFAEFPGERLRNLFRDAGGPTPETYEIFLEMLDRAMGLQVDKAQSERVGGGDSQGAGSAIKVLQSAIRTLYEGSSSEYANSFRTVVQQSRTNSWTGRTLSYWCFSPAIAMEDLKRINLRCMLLTSGTLSPMNSFASELRVDFPIRLENPHVVTEPQVWAGIVKLGPDHDGVKGGRLTSAFYARGDDSHLELGRTMIEIASLVPDGILVFFPSYGTMNACIDTWRRMGPKVGGAKPSVWEMLLRRKPIVAEERESSKFGAAILAHKANVDGKRGSILMAVCRGKVSEGIDFSDEYGRAVVITGLPYPSAFDPKIVLKREFADEEAKKFLGNSARAARGIDDQRINGSQWYTTQAVRAVNQALGRAIRHRYDYGAIILCDERFQAKNLQRQISKWIQPSLFVCPTFQKAADSLRGFFIQAVQSPFAKAGEQLRLRAQTQQRENERIQKPEDELSILRTAQEALTHHIPPQITESQFMKRIISFSNELKTDKSSPDIASRKRECRSNEGQVMTILDFGSENAQSVGTDGCCTQSKGWQTAPSTPDKRKLSSIFLEKRAKRASQGRIEDNAKRRAVSRRLRVGQDEPDGINCSTESSKNVKEPFSHRIKKAFAKSDAKTFLDLFNKVVGLHREVQGVLRDSPKSGKLEAVEEGAKKALGDVVELVRKKAREQVADSLLTEFRRKVPREFREWYDDVLGT